jgi:murein DD-endopeptidase MepM/ murein hydrolase activator NlpD
VINSTNTLHRILRTTVCLITVALLLLIASPITTAQARPLGGKEDCTSGRERALRSNEVDFLDACKYVPSSSICQPSQTLIGGALPTGGSSTLEGHTLPASHGGTGSEEVAYIDDSGTVRLKRNNAALSAASSLKGKLQPNDAEFYSAMRLRYAIWNWNGNSKKGPEDNAWYYKSVRKLLVINPRTKLAVVTALIETGPAPWTGTPSNSSGSPPAYWQGYVDGTPTEYNGRVAGLSPAAFRAIGAKQWTYGGPSGGKRNSGGDDLIYQWAPDQNTPSGTVYTDAGIPGGVPAENTETAVTTCPGTPADGSIGTTIDGFVFPLQTTKSTLSGNSPRWCFSNQNNCHHDYNAADIFAPTGTTILAARPGTVVATNYSSKFGQNVQIRGSDGINYFYNHMPQGKNKVHKGDVVKAGDPIGEVGTNANAAGTPKHLHFDMTKGVPRRPSCSAASCASMNNSVFINVQPFLVAAYNGLAN